MDPVQSLLSLTDYQARKLMPGFAIGLALYCKAHHPPGSEPYKQMYVDIYNKLRDRLKKADEGTILYEAKATLKRGNTTIGYAGSFNERSEDEVRQRVKDKYRTYKIVSLEITKITKITKP